MSEQSDPITPRNSLSAAIRIAALFVLLAGGVWIATRILVARAAANFTVRSNAHLDREVQRIRGEIASTEGTLEGAVGKVAERLAENPAASRAETFSILRQAMEQHPRRGIRIVTPNGEAIAWWGEDLRTAGATSYEFDATNLYVIRSRVLPSPAISVQAFERVPNTRRERKLLDPDDDWISGLVFHPGVLRQEGKTYVMQDGDVCHFLFNV